MAYTSGSATDYKDLLVQVSAFAAANGWTILEQSATKCYMKGLGLAGTDEIYVGIECIEQSGSYYNWRMVGSYAWRPGRGLDQQPRSSGFEYIYLWNQPISFRMVCNGRRIIVVAKVSTVYQVLHLGLLTPVATEAQNPYPLLVGGMGGSPTNTYSSTGDNNNAFWGAGNQASSKMCIPGGLWTGKYDSGGLYAGNNIFYVGHSFTSANSESLGVMAADPDGNFLLEEIFCCDSSWPSLFGTVEGLFRVAGNGNSSENVITISGVNYMVFQNAYRTSGSDYSALRLN